MRKFFLGSISIFSLLFVGYISFAQENMSGENEKLKTVEADLTRENVQKSINDVNQISASVCNQKGTFFSLTPGEEKDMCFQFNNNNDEDVYIASDFFQTEFTVGGTPTCNSGNPDNLFTKSMLDRSVVSRVIVPAKSSIQKSIKVKFPLGSSGLYHFCHYYRLDGGGTNIPMFNIVVKKQSFFDILVNSSDTKLSGRMELISLTKVKGEEGNKSVKGLSFSLKNNFPFDQKADISLTISNIFGFKKEFVLDGGIIGYNRTKDFYFDVSDLPYYKGLFTLGLKVNYKPVFGFDVSGGGIPQDIINGGEISEHTSFFIFDKSQVMMLGFLILIIFLIKMAFFTKPKVVYIEQNNQSKK